MSRLASPTPLGKPAGCPKSIARTAHHLTSLALVLLLRRSYRPCALCERQELKRPLAECRSHRKVSLAFGRRANVMRRIVHQPIDDRWFQDLRFDQTIGGSGASGASKHSRHPRASPRGSSFKPLRCSGSVHGNRVMPLPSLYPALATHHRLGPLDPGVGRGHEPARYCRWHEPQNQPQTQNSRDSLGRRARAPARRIDCRRAHSPHSPGTVQVTAIAARHNRTLQAIDARLPRLRLHNPGRPHDAGESGRNRDLGRQQPAGSAPAVIPDSRGLHPATQGFQDAPQSTQR